MCDECKGSMLHPQVCLPLQEVSPMLRPLLSGFLRIMSTPIEGLGKDQFPLCLPKQYKRLHAAGRN